MTFHIIFSFFKQRHKNGMYRLAQWWNFGQYVPGYTILYGILQKRMFNFNQPYDINFLNPNEDIQQCKFELFVSVLPPSYSRYKLISIETLLKTDQLIACGTKLGIVISKILAPSSSRQRLFQSASRRQNDGRETFIPLSDYVCMRLKCNIMLSMRLKALRACSSCAKDVKRMLSMR